MSHILVCQRPHTPWRRADSSFYLPAAFLTMSSVTSLR